MKSIQQLKSPKIGLIHDFIKIIVKQGDKPLLTRHPDEFFNVFVTFPVFGS